MERAPSQPLPHTIRSVDRWTDRKTFGDGVKRFSPIGSRVIVDRIVGVKVGSGVFVARGVSV
jgi:hypothetical protein